MKGFAVNNVRTLYAPAALGIDGFLFAKEKIKSQFTNSVDKFKEKMTEFSQESNSMIFTEDLKNMIHLADNEKDLVLVNNMIRKYVYLIFINMIYEGDTNKTIFQIQFSRKRD